MTWLVEMETSSLMWMTLLSRGGWSPMSSATDHRENQCLSSVKAQWRWSSEPIENARNSSPGSFRPATQQWTIPLSTGPVWQTCASVQSIKTVTVSPFWHIPAPARERASGCTGSLSRAVQLPSANTVLFTIPVARAVWRLVTTGMRLAHATSHALRAATVPQIWSFIRDGASSQSFVLSDDLCSSPRDFEI